MPTRMQPATFHIALRPDTDLRGALVILGAPGLGLVGSIASQYVIGHLEMPLVGAVHSARLPPAVQVVEGRPVPHVRVYAKEARGRFGVTTERLVVIHTEAEIAPEWTTELAEAIVQWARASKCGTLAVVDGILVEGEGSEDVVLGVATSTEGLKALEQQKVPLLPAGTVGGIAGAVLQAAARHEVNAVALLAEAAPGYPDAAAAARLVEILDRMVPGIRIETAPLLKEAERIEIAVRKLKENVEAEASKRTETTSMYG